MSFGAILLLSFGLAMDATAVAAARGLVTPRVRARHLVMVAAFFGGFQAFMPLLGWLVGSRISPLVQAWDHWIAFVLLSLVGGKMLWEALASKADEDQGRAGADLYGFQVMLLLAVATSIDAFAAGITLPMLQAPILLSVGTIGATTAVLSALGLLVGRHFGAALGRGLDFAGGLVLVTLGIKLLVQHLAL